MSTSSIRRRRGTVRASITRKATRLKELEGKTDSTSHDLAQGMVRKLESLDSEFHRHHFELLDLVPEGDEDAMAKEQEALDHHDDEVALLAACIKQFIVSCSSSSSSSSSSSDSNLCKLASRKLSRLEKSIIVIHDAINATPIPTDACLLRQYEEQLRDLK